MLFSSWPRNWLQQIAQRWFVQGGRRRRSRRVPTPTRRWVRPRLEALEDRLTPSGDVLALFEVHEIAPNQPSGANIVQLQDSHGYAVTAASDVTVKLSSTSSTGQFLDLSSHPLANSSVVIPAGSSFALFEYEDSQTGFPAITAQGSDGSSSRVGAVETVQGALAFTTPAQALATNQLSQPITVQLQDGNGNAVAATSNVTVNLSVNSFPNGGQFFDTSGNPLSTPSITIPAGSSSASFEYEDSQTGTPLLAAQANGAPVLQQESVGNPLFITTPSQVLTPGQPSKPITVQLVTPAASDMTLNLSSTSSTGQFLDTSGNPLSTPSITIPAGSSSASFEYEDSQTGTPQLLATEAGNPLAGASQGENVGGTSGLVNIVSPAQAMTANQPAQITVQLQDFHTNPLPAENNLTLTLSSSSSTGQFLDTAGNPLSNSSIVIPAGSSSVSFEYKDSQVGIPKLTVSYPGFGGVTQQTSQQEDVGTSLVFTTAAQTFAAGQTSQPITVQLQDSSGNPITASSDVNVGLLSSRPVGSQFLDTSGNPLSSFFGLTIPAGSSSASFEYKSVWGGTPTLTAAVSGNAPNVAALTAKQQETINGLSSLAITTPATIAVSQTPQTSSLITVQLEDNNGNAAVAPSGGLTVNLSAFLGSSPATGLTFLDANGNPLSSPSLTIPAGSSTASFKFQYQTTLAGIPLGISAAVPNSPLAATQFATVQAGPPASVAFSTSPRSVAAGVPSGSIVVSLHDQFGNLAEAGSGGVTINLSSSSTGGQFLSVSGDPLASPSVTIPQGSSSATIEYEDSQAGTPMLTAAANGLTSGTQTETITPVSAEIHVTNTNDSGTGSLRAAITAANAAPGSTIVFDAGVTGTIDLLSALPAITASANILGPGANVLTVERGAAATGTFGGFVVGTAPTILPVPGPAVILSGLTVANFDDTGIVNYGSLNLRQVVVNNNNASGMNLPPFGDPGGILNEAFNGSLTVLDSTISNNSTSNSLVAAGIDSEVGSVTIINSTISGNVDNGSNSAGGIGIYGGSAYIANSTISGNTATQQTGTNNNSGGGIDAPSLLSFFGGTASPSVTLYDTIVAGNTGSVNNPTDVSGAFASLGNNLIGEANSQSSGFVGSDQVGTTTNPINPLLGPLAPNGGPTPTMALLTGSPALAAGSSVNAPATDQRGDPRPTSGAIDIGAVELTTSSSNSLTLSPSSLPPDTVGAAYKQTITASGGSGTVTLTTSGSLPMGLTFTLNGNQVTISGRPQTSGTFKFSVTATDSAGDSVTQNYTLTINVPVPINLNPTKLRFGKVGKVYNQAITASGGVGNLTVTYQVVSSSTLGLNFNVNGGELDITGTPTATGSVTFLVTATDPNGDITTQRYTLKIRR